MTTPPNFLFKKHRNAIVMCITESGFSWSEFAVDEKPSPNGTGGKLRLFHSPTNFYFTISANEMGSYQVEFSPGESDRIKSRPDGPITWPGVLGYLKIWLKLLAEEIQAPDLWHAVSGDTQLIRLAADQGNQTFTPEEQIKVKLALGEIKAYLIKSQQLSETQTKKIDGQFKYMEEAAGRLGRKDYINIVISTLFMIAYDQAFSTDATIEILKFAGQVFKQVLHHVFYLTGPR